MNCNNQSPARQKVFILVHADGFLEVFGDNITAKIIRCPVAQSRQSERDAEDYVELSLPWTWRQVYFPGYLRASASLRPLLPSKLAEARGVAELIKTINSLTTEDAA